MTKSTIVNQPVSDIQLNQLKVEWVAHETVKPNRYNPNKMTWHDRMLLRQSLLEDGWTQPIVTLPDGTIVDGEQRWTTAGLELTPDDIQAVIERMLERQQSGAVLSESIMERLTESRKRLEQALAEGKRGCIAAITGGLVPITRVDFKDDAHKMISTIRHNRARGTHQLDSMSTIAADLVALGLDFDDLETRLGMDDDEITRLLDAANAVTQAEQLLEETAGEFSQAWEPVHITELEADDAVLAELQRSREAAAAQKAHQVELAKRQETVREKVQEAIVAQEAEAPAPLTQEEKDAIRRQVEAAVPKPNKPADGLALKRFTVFVSAEEYDVIVAALGGENMAEMLVTLCRGILAQRQSEEQDEETAEQPADELTEVAEPAEVADSA